MSRENLPHHLLSWIVLTLACLLPGRIGVAAEPALIGHWKLNGNIEDSSKSHLPARNHGAQLTPRGARFDGIDDWLEVPANEFGELLSGDFTLSLWASADSDADDRAGDLVSWYEPSSRSGLQLGLKTNEVTTSRSNFRNLHFGLDNNRLEKEWTDHGRVGNATFVFGFAVHQGELFVATCEPELGDAGKVYRWSKEGKWTDCGIPVRSNSVTSLIEFRGSLYAASGKYRLGGSALKESPNAELGGKVFRYEADGKWRDCGQLETEAIGGLAEYQGHLYAASLYRPAGFFRYEGEQKWTPLQTPNGKRVEAMCVHNGELFASSYDEAHVYRFNGQQWTDCGQVGDATNTQTYSFAIHNGQMYVGTWRSGKVFRYDGDNRWVDCGRLGEELEVMGMLVHNGRLLAGSLPLAGVFQYDGDTSWKLLEQVDRTPDVMYRRAWTMAEYKGRVFVGTLPSGRVLSNQVGVNVTHDQAFPAGWHHVAAQRSGSKLVLLVDGQSVGESVTFKSDGYKISLKSPLKIGLGSNDYFRGEIRDVRLYRGALSTDAIRELAQTNSESPPK